LSILTTEPLHEALPPPPYGDEGFNLAHTIESAVHSETLTEWVFIIISLLVAGLGIALGWLFYVKNPGLPDLWASRLHPLYQASYNKYWVDEFFGWAITRRTMDAARAVFGVDSKVVDGAVNGSARLTKLASRITGGVDQYFVDGLVNAVAAFIVRLMSPLFRAAQTGLAQNYALVMVFGLVAAVALFFGADILKAVRSVFAIGF
jgi:NADH-quinone oxidoreductase subunit L